MRCMHLKEADGLANIHTSLLAKNTKDIDLYITTNYISTIVKLLTLILRNL